MSSGSENQDMGVFEDYHFEHHWRGNIKGETLVSNLWNTEVRTSKISENEINFKKDLEGIGDSKC